MDERWDWVGMVTDSVAVDDVDCVIGSVEQLDARWAAQCFADLPPDSASLVEAVAQMDFSESVRRIARNRVACATGDPWAPRYAIWRAVAGF